MKIEERMITTKQLQGSNGLFGEREEGSFYPERPRVFLCLGSDKLIFDCLGPLVGSLLALDGNFDRYVYGTMENPVTARQVETAIRFIRRFHFGAEVIVVDSAVGRCEEIGKIKFFGHGLRPALGIDKNMKVVGDKSIMGIVTTKEKVKSPACDVKLGFVMDMAKKIAARITDECNSGRNFCSLAPDGEIIA